MSSEFRHKSLLGYTGTGKTTLLIERIKTYRKYKQKIILYSGNGDISGFKGCNIVWDVDELEAALNDPKNYGSFVVLDEGADIYEEANKKDHPTVKRLFRKGRHKGYTCWIATQYPTAIPKSVRRMCTERYIFGTADEEDAVAIWKDCGRIDFNGVPLWKAIMELPKFEYFRYLHPSIISKHKTKKIR